MDNEERESLSDSIEESPASPIGTNGLPVLPAGVEASFKSRRSYGKSSNNNYIPSRELFG